MKKQKSSTAQIPIHLSSQKRSQTMSLKHNEQLFCTPYKIEWKNSQNDEQQIGYGKQSFKNLQNSNIALMSGNGSTNKAFYQNMKNQLMNIKQDVEKMILKERKEKTVNSVSNDLGQNGYIKTINIKNKCQQKKVRVDSLQNYERIFESKLLTKDEDKKSNNQQSCINIPKSHQKNFYSEKGEGLVRGKSKSIADMVSQDIEKRNFLQYDRTERCFPANNVTVENKKQEKITIDKFIEVMKKNSEVGKQRIEVDILLPSFDKKIEKQKMIENLKFELNELENDMTIKEEQLKKNQELIQSLKIQLEKSKQRIVTEKSIQKQELQVANTRILQLQASIVQKSSEIDSLQLTIKQKFIQINELSIKLANKQQQIKNLLAVIHNYQQIQKRNQQKNLTQQVRLLQQRQNQRQRELNQYKIALQQQRQKSKNLTQINHSKQSKSRESEELGLKFNRIHQQYQQLQQKFNTVSHQNNQLKAQQQLLIIDKQNQQTVYELLNNPNLMNVGQQISNKLSQMIEQNYSLKNKISHLQSSMEQLNFYNGSLKSELRIHEERADSQTVARRLKVEDWDQLNNEKDQLQDQVQNLRVRIEQTKQYYELQIMKKQNEISDLKVKVSLILDDQQQQVHANVRSIKHINNIDSLLYEFKDMIEYNLEMQERIKELEKERDE